jgi:hypothetical protein
MCNGLHREVFLTGSLSFDGELCTGTNWRSLRFLSTGIAIHLSIHHQDVYVLACAQHMIQATKPNIIGPTITSHDPDRFLLKKFSELV